jgi:hypothetical protein
VALRYAWNQVKARRNEEDQEYLEDIGSAQCWCEDMSLVPKPLFVMKIIRRSAHRYAITTQLLLLRREDKEYDEEC